MTSSPIQTIRNRIGPKAWFQQLKRAMRSLSSRWKMNFVRRWHAFSRDTNFPYAIGLFAFCLAALFGWHTFAPTFYHELWVEFGGLTFDVFFILIVFALFEHRRQKAQDIRRQQEIIDDYKKWNSDEVKLRVAGAIRRLNRLGKTDIDFGGIELQNFSFRRNDIRSISGSTFYDGTWGEMGSRDQVILDKVDFSHLDCQGVVFSRFNPFSGLDIDVMFASITNCRFEQSNLSGAVFKGAHLEWTSEHPAEFGVWHEFQDEPPAFEQTHYPPFSGASLSKASFENAKFKNADFRQADDILECDFKGAKGIESCLFDDENTKTAVLRKTGECNAKTK